MTDTPTAARDHARAQAGTQVATMPTIPASSATDLPDGVDAADVVWDETIAGGTYSSITVPRGTVVRFVDVDGDACANLVLHHRPLPLERLNVADTVKVQWQAYLGAGSVLLSDLGRALATITTDTSGTHDCFSGASTRAANEARYGSGTVEGAHPNARDHFGVALAKHGLDRRDIPPCVSLFKGVRIEADGAMTWQGGPGPAGAVIELIAELDLIVTVVNVPHVLDPRDDYTVTPLRLTAWRHRATAPDDDQWTSTPERERAYRNAEAYVLGAPTGQVAR